MSNETIREIDLEVKGSDEILNAPEQAPAPAASKKAAEKNRGKEKNGVGLLWVMTLLLLTNMAWFAYVKLYIGPQQDTIIRECREAIAEKDKEVEGIKAVYEVREQDFEKRLTEAEQTITELKEEIDAAQKLLEEYRKGITR